MRSPIDPEQVLREARTKFVASFPSHVERIGRLLGDPDDRAGAELRQIVHRMAGFGGTVGLPTVSARAAEFEALLGRPGDPPCDLGLARDMAGALREAFTRDLAAPPAWLEAAGQTAARRLTVLVVEDNTDQADILTRHLAAAGHRPIHVASGDRAIDVARIERPDATLLDVELPGLDGFSICRLMKADPALAATPIVFMTTRSRLDDRMTGLTLGADEYLTKPVDTRELLLRLQLLAGRAAAAGPPAVEPDVLDYAEFLGRARPILASAPGCLALVRVPHARANVAARLVREQMRPRDLAGRYDAQHLVVLLPDMSAAAAADRLQAIAARLATFDVSPVHAGIAASTEASAASLESLLVEADEALADAQAGGVPASLRSGRLPHGRRAPVAARARRILVAADDPAIVRIVEAHLRASGIETTLAFDGRQALDLVTLSAPDVLVLDLVAPKMTGFDLLEAVRTLAPRPGILVLSARGREQDVIRAFDLGADDYMVEPFSPQELKSRIGRLLRERRWR